MTTDFKNVFDSLVIERGGRQNLSVVHMAVIRALAAALTGDPAASPTTIASLGALLPPPQQTGDEHTYDLRILTNAELRQLEFLTARAAGLKPEKPPRVRRTRREEDALEFAQFLDAIVRRAEKPTDAETIQIRNHIHYVLRGVADPNALYSYLGRPAPAAVAAPQPMSLQTPEPEPVEAAPNVVALPTGPNKPRSVFDGQKLQNYDEPWRGQVRPNIT